MNILISILLLFAGILALIFIIALFIKKEHYVRREVIINASAQKAFDYLKFLKNQESFNKHAMADSNRKKEFRGTDGTVGFVYAWSGDKSAGQGEKEIIALVEGKRIEAEIRFVKPMTAVAEVILDIASLSDKQCKVYWSNRSTLNFPLNIMVPMVEKMVAKEMDSSLLTLKSILEK